MEVGDVVGGWVVNGKTTTTTEKKKGRKGMHENRKGVK